MRDFSVGAVLSESISVLFANIVAFIAMSLMIYMPLFFVEQAINSATTGGASIGIAMLGLLVVMLGGQLVTAAITYASIQYLRGSPASIGDCVGVGLNRALPVLAVTLLQLVAIVVGTILFIIPGIILACMFYVAIPASVVEQPGVIGALERSVKLTEGYRIQIFLLLLVVVVLGIGLGVVQGLVFGPNLNTIPAGIAGMVINTIIGAWGATLAAVAYFRLRSAKESITIDDIARTFD